MESSKGVGRLHRHLVGLADGSRKSAAARERVERSPELAGLLAEQERAVRLVRAAAPPASAYLRARLAHAEPIVRRHRPNLGLAAAAAGVIALAIVAVLPGASDPTVARAAQLASLGPTGPAPTPDAAHPGSLSDSVDGVRYPYWQDALGFGASGARADRLDGRLVMTVYYTSGGGSRQTTGYTIVSGSALPEPSKATVAQRDGIRFLSLHSASRNVVTWRRAGHTCVLSSGPTVPVSRLLALAVWKPAAA